MIGSWNCRATVIAAYPLCRVLHCLDGSMQSSPSGEAEQPLAKWLPLQQDHDDEDDDESACCNGLKQRPENPLHDRERPGFGLLYLYWYRFHRLCGLPAASGRTAHLRFPLAFRSPQLLAQIAENLRRSTKDSGPGYHPEERADFGLEVVLVFRTLLRQRGNFPR